MPIKLQKVVDSLAGMISINADHAFWSAVFVELLESTAEWQNSKPTTTSFSVSTSKSVVDVNRVELHLSYHNEQKDSQWPILWPVPRYPSHSLHRT